MKHIVGLSGGIDSQAAALWARNRFPKEDVVLLNSNAGGNEHAITTDYLHRYGQVVHPVVFVEPTFQDFFYTESSDGIAAALARARETAIRRGHNPDAPLSFLDMMRLKQRAPSRRAQFCTGILKLAPAVRWIHEHTQGEQYERITGLRRDESPNRAETPAVEDDPWFYCRVQHRRDGQRIGGELETQQAAACQCGFESRPVL